MSLTSPLRRAVAATALGAALLTATTGIAGAATISNPVVVMPGAKIPIDFPGYREPANDRLPANFRIVERKVDLQHGERANVRLTVPEGFRLVTIGLSDQAGVGARVTDIEYVGKRAVTLQMHAHTAGTDSTRFTVYALAKRA
jgi:hypothetical protein